MAITKDSKLKMVFGVLFLFLLTCASWWVYFQQRQADEVKKNNDYLQSELSACKNGPASTTAENNGTNAGATAVPEGRDVLAAGAVAPAEAVKKAVDYVNKSMLSEGTAATSKDIVEANGLYKFSLVVEGKDYNAYVTRDGKLMFADGIPQAIDLDKPTSGNSENNSAEIPKTAKPDVQVFVMSYCPYGLQAEKMYLPVYDALKNKATMGIYFVNYAMHGKKEIDENLRQYCIQKEQAVKYPVYLKCFVSGTTDSEGIGEYAKCLTEAAVDKAKLDACVAASDKQFNVTANYDDKSKWLSGNYPKFDVHNELNEKYNIQGSPTIIINGVEASIGKRSPQELLKAVCGAFANPPAECKIQLSSDQPSSSFGSGTESGSGGGCGG
ncbi:MAG: hypothetical protein MUD10_02955 [Candidatus Pacebacteria bacterium]|jgi:hypothetical protein|nr:hypothetical protein [Candidatus Paceibacterota bacterium]